MQRVKVIGISANFNGGEVQINREQYKTRAHNLLVMKAPVVEDGVEVECGVYRVVGPIQFKNGEEFGFDGPVNKALIKELETGGPAPVHEAVVASSDNGTGDSGGKKKAKKKGRK